MNRKTKKYISSTFFSWLVTIMLLDCLFFAKQSNKRPLTAKQKVLSPFKLPSPSFCLRKSPWCTFKHTEGSTVDELAWRMNPKIKAPWKKGVKTDWHRTPSFIFLCTHEDPKGLMYVFISISANFKLKCDFHVQHLWGFCCALKFAVICFLCIIVFETSSANESPACSLLPWYAEPDLLNSVLLLTRSSPFLNIYPLKQQQPIWKNRLGNPLVKKMSLEGNTKMSYVYIWTFAS